MAIFEQPMNNYDPFADRVGQTLAPAGTFMASIEDIVDELRVQRKKYQSEELETVDMTCFLFCYKNSDGEIHRISSPRMKISGYEKSNLFGFLKSLLGRNPTYGWDYCTLKGSMCLLTVEHAPRRDGKGVFAKISELSPVPIGMAEITRQDVPGTPSVDGDEDFGL
ncbi:hypothetical protein P0Y35_09635 [Kiritimatiellaeota bacterium B1221]|nr:hypothetical protein [Kiritimatiellaeota bacterium B1221]